jgi:hypothetical protein
MSIPVLTLLRGGFRHLLERVGRGWTGNRTGQLLKVRHFIHTVLEYRDDVEARASTRA